MLPLFTLFIANFSKLSDVSSFTTSTLTLPSLSNIPNTGILPSDDFTLKDTYLIYEGSLVKDAVKEVRDLGIPAIILFGIPEHKDEGGADTWSDEGIIQRALRLIKRKCRICML